MCAKIKKTSESERRRYKPKGVSKKSFEKTFWPYLPLLIASCLLLVFSQSANVATAVRHPRSHVLAYATSMSVSGLLASTNTQRLSSGVGSLTLNDKLDASAQAKANDMASRNYWSHNTPEGNPPWVFVSAQGYSYQKLGENLATGFSDEQSTISGWMASPPHRENLLDPSFTEVGFGYANNPDYTAAGGGPMTIVVAFYGKPQVLASSITQTPPAASASPAPKVPTPPTEVPPSQVAPTPAESQSQPTTEAKAPNTSHQIANATTPSKKQSNAQVAMSNMPMSNIATGLAIFGLVLTLAVWASRHLLTIRRMWKNGEKFAIHHPVADVGLVVSAAVCYLLIQTAGLVR